jgi:hypothetical protein
MSALTISQTVDVLDMMADSEDGLPSSDGIGADNGMFGGELTTNVLGLGIRRSRC